MWEWVEVWKDGREVKFGPFDTVERAAKQCGFCQMDWADEVVHHIIVRRIVK